MFGPLFLDSVRDFPLLASTITISQCARITPQLGLGTRDMYKKKKVAALKHRQRQKKFKEKRKAQAPPTPPKEQ
jgi:hypothetical protein